jgi:hypothetical protein
MLKSATTIASFPETSPIISIISAFSSCPNLVLSPIGKSTPSFKANFNYLTLK